MKNEFSYTIMPMGKFKGRFLKEIPEDYLQWAASNLNDKGLALMFRAELANRKVDWKKLEDKFEESAKKK
jgi:hypothetical protein